MCTDRQNPFRRIRRESRDTHNQPRATVAQFPKEIIKRPDGTYWRGEVQMFPQGHFRLGEIVHVHGMEFDEMIHKVTKMRMGIPMAVRVLKPVGETIPPAMTTIGWEHIRFIEDCYLLPLPKKDPGYEHATHRYDPSYLVKIPVVRRRRKS